MSSTKSGISKRKSDDWIPSEQQYKQIASRREPPRAVGKNCVFSFLVGGTICLIGQAIQQLYITFLSMTEKQASNLTVVTLILLAVILTCFGVYDKIAQWGGAGTAVPVTGFANSMCSAAIEHRSEGLVLGVGASMFKLAGSVVVFGTVAAFIIALIYLIFGFRH